MSECIFCKIIKGELPSNIVYQDETVVCFKDINPQAPVHILVVPKKHIPTLLDLDASDGQILSAIYNAIKQLASEFGLGNGFRVVTNYGKEGGQTVYHIHFHLLGKRPMGWPPG